MPINSGGFACRLNSVICPVPRFGLSEGLEYLKN